MSDKGRPRSFDRADALMRAMQVFWEKGYEGASLTALTAAMGINAPSLYAAFGCKEALYLEAMELYVQTVGTEIWAPLEDSADGKGSGQWIPARDSRSLFSAGYPARLPDSARRTSPGSNSRSGLRSVDPPPHGKHG
ncbi:AcrR family transcriptional regulator [Sinorhizobium meliloti]